MDCLQPAVDRKESKILRPCSRDLSAQDSPRKETLNLRDLISARSVSTASVGRYSFRMVGDIPSESAGI